MSKGCILAVDDERVALRLLREFLEEDGYTVITATDGEEAIKIIDEHNDKLDAIVLDRVMPRMDGMGVLNAIKQDMRFVGLPIIMQTSVADKDEVRNAIRAGAYYYVTKPYDGITLGRVVQAAIEKFRQFREVMSWGIEATAGLTLLRSGTFEVRTIQEGRMVANLLADLAERSVPVINGLMELITNSIENGNLSVDSNEKSAFVASGNWDEEIKRRIFLPENIEKFVTIRFEVSGQFVSVEIEDQGNGFDWKKYIVLDEGRAYDVHGRGIAMAHAHSFESMTYYGTGSIAHVSFTAS